MLLERFSILKQFYFSPPTELDLPLELLVSQDFPRLARPKSWEVV